MIEVKNLYKKYEEHYACQDINFKIEKGDVIAIIGPSGSGKTTILRCLNFLTKADQGTLLFDNEEIDLRNVSHKKIQEIRKKTGFVFQNFNLFLNKTVLQNVIEGLLVARKMEKRKAIEIGMAMLEKVGMESKINAYPNALSGGQQQRVAIARALALNPEIIYFDEPTSALDPELIGEVLEVMKKLAKEGLTMAVVTHEMNFAKSIASKVIFMEDGKIVEYNNAKDFFENPKSDRAKRFLKKITEK